LFRAPLPPLTALPAATPPVPAATVLPSAPPCVTCHVDRSPTAMPSQIDPAAPAYRTPAATASRTHPPRGSSGDGTECLPAAARVDRCPARCEHRRAPARRSDRSPP